MATPKLQITVRNSTDAIDKLIGFRNEASHLEAKYQHFISEMMMLRLFSIFESSVAELAYKLASGASYINGNGPGLTCQAAGSMSAARGLFLSHGRTRQVNNLKWTKARFIRESVQHVIPPSDPFINSAQRNGSTIEEMRKIRNVLAHSTSSAKTDYRQVVRRAYGANVSIPVGAFLCTTRREQTCKLEQYLVATKVILVDLGSGN